MKSFEKWTRDLAEHLNNPVASDGSIPIIRKRNIHEILLDYEDPTAEGGYSYPCKSCGDLSPIYCDPEDFNEDCHYCGKNQWCLP